MNAAKLHEVAQTLAADYLRTEGKLLSVLMEMRRGKLFATLNYTGIFTYCRDALKLSEAQSLYFQKVAEKAEEVPAIKSAIVQGAISLSKARRILPVVTKENHEEWIEKAKTLPQKELERQVSALNPRGHVRESLKPVAKELSVLRIPVDTATEETLNTLSHILAQKFQRHLSHAEIVAFALKECRERLDPVKRAARAKRSRKPLAAPKSGRNPVRTSTRHAVVRRHGVQCSHIGPDGRRCEQRRWLHLHHRIPVARGGLNTVDNLQPLCGAHHALAHSISAPRSPCDSRPGASAREPRAPTSRRREGPVP